MTRKTGDCLPKLCVVVYQGWGSVMKACKSPTLQVAGMKSYTSEPYLRRATTSDLDEIIRQRIGMFRDAGYTADAALEAMRATSEPYIRQALVDGSFVCWIAEFSPREPVGCGAVHVSHTPSHPLDPQCWRATILNVYTYPQYRRRGIARRLMNAMIDWCREQGFASVSLHASADGRPLYEALGFQPTAEMRLSLRANPPRSRGQ